MNCAYMHEAHALRPAPTSFADYWYNAHAAGPVAPGLLATSMRCGLSLYQRCRVLGLRGDLISYFCTHVVPRFLQSVDLKMIICIRNEDARRILYKGTETGGTCSDRVQMPTTMH